MARACEGWLLSDGCETFLTAGCSCSHCARAFAFSECALLRSASVSTPWLGFGLGFGFEFGFGFGFAAQCWRAGGGRGRVGFGLRCCLDELEGVEG